MVKIDVRRLMSFGNGSFIVSMPKRWIEKNKLKKGDLISVDDEGCELVLKSSQEESKPDAKDISIDAKGKDMELLKAEIVSSYLNNYDTLTIIFDSNHRDIPKVKNMMRNLSGLEIMEQTSTRIVAKNLININEISIQNIIRRMDVIARAMIEDALLCSRGGCTYDSIINRDADVNRLYYLAFRVMKNAMKSPRVSKSLGTEPWQLHSDMLLIKHIERTADKQKRIARYLDAANLDRQSLDEFGMLYADISESYNEAMKSYYTQNKEIACRIEVTTKNRTGNCNIFLEKYTESHGSSKNKDKRSNPVMVAKIIENLKGTAIEIRDIARTVLCYE